MTIPLIISMILVLAANTGLTMTAFRASGKKLLRKAVILTAGGLVLLYALDAVLFHFTLCEQPAVPLFAAALTEIAVSASILLIGKPEKRMTRFLAAAVRMLCISLILELVVFCGNCYSLHPSSETKNFAEYGAEILSDSLVYEGAGILVSGNGDFQVMIEREDVRYVRLAAETEDTFYQVQLHMTDDNFSLVPQCVAQTWMNASQDTITLPLTPYGTLHRLKFSFLDIEGKTPVCLTAMTLTNVKPYSFSVLRFLALAGVLCLITAIRIFEWYRVRYDRRDTSHRLAVVSVMLLCMSAVMWVMPGIGLVDYSTEIGADPYDPYAQTFDAWQRGQLNLHVETDPILAAMENPYDRSARNAAGAESEWDKAFYDGKYYSYFGIAPVIFLYYPTYLLTGKLPTTAAVCAVFSLLSVVFLFALIMTVLRKYGRQVNFLLLLCGLTAAAAASGIPMCMQCADRYYAAFASGICFLYLFLWLGLEAVMANTQRSRCILLAGCGLAIAAAVLSRPTLALYAVLLIPPFLAFIRQKSLTLRQKTAAVSCFAVPLSIGAAVTMAYNAARFGSPFDFGATYQITVSNTAANRISLSELPASIIYYFFTPVEFGSVFPFIVQSVPSFATPTHYVYAPVGFGAFMFLMIPLAYLCVGTVTGRRFCTLEKRAVYRLAFLCPVIMAFLDFCMGGYNSRYLCDILPLLAVFSVPVILEVQRRLRPVPAVYGFFSRMSAAVMLLAPVFMLALFLSLGEQFTIWRNVPEFYFEMQDLFVFWR